MTPFHFFWDKKFSKTSLGFIFSSSLFVSFLLSTPRNEGSCVSLHRW